MGRYLVRRFASMLIVLFVVSVAVFWMIRLLPGDPAAAMLAGGNTLDPAALKLVRHDLGLDQPLPLQYADWLGRTVRGNWGTSTRSHQAVTTAIRQRAPVTLQIQGLTLIFGLLIGVPAGIVAGAYRNSWTDRMASATALCGVAMPSFWLGILLILLFSVRLHWLPTSGYVSPLKDVKGFCQHAALPVITGALAGSTAVVMRQVRSSLAGALEQDYVRTARAKGLTEPRVIVGHALRNAMLPVVTVIGLSVGRLLGGSVIIEEVFALPGMGRLAVDSIAQRDFPVIQGVVLLIAAVVVLVNFLTDLSYAVLDPRIRLS